MEIINPKLSICIATYNRGKFIAETLDSILYQMQPGVELIVVDGASPDNTEEVMKEYLFHYPEIRYYRESVNAGIDGDYDKAVGYALGTYCWLMTDDDILKPGAIKKVLFELDGLRDLVVVNAETRIADLTKILIAKQLVIDGDRSYAKNEIESFFTECIGYLSFIGCVVVRRKFWMERDRRSFYGTLFIHVGVIFQQPRIENVYIISDPQLIIRYGNAMWTSRGFEIWSFIWPKLVWSFTEFSDDARRSACDPAPWKSIKTLFYSRAIGTYSKNDFSKFIYLKTRGINRFLALGIAIFPAALANIISLVYCIFFKVGPLDKYDLLRSRHATLASQYLAKFLRN